MYAVFRTERFDKELLKQLSREEQRKVERLEQQQLTVNPYAGDPLGNRFFREKKLGVKRAYYLVYEDLRAVLLVAISDKKTQQETIDEIRTHLADYYA
ncbi:MAG TPA: hypothetical protein VLJ21_01960, partial [Candidatus Binatia bacterium]|nr:hypothetical protein [Candidatus Binatia bacterium]